MTTHIGREGKIRVGSNAVIEVVSFNLNIQKPRVTDTALGDDWETSKAGTGNWSGQLVCMFDPDDSTGQEALEAAVASGADVALELRPEGDTATNKEYSGNAALEAIDLDVSGNDAITGRSFSYRGNGALTIGTV